MKLVLYIQVKAQENIQFSNPFVTKLKAKGYLIFEADNHSDDYLLSIGKELLSDHKEVILYFQAEENESIGKLRSLFEGIRKSDAHFKGLMIGKNQPLEKMLHFLKLDFVTADTLELEEAFFKSV